MGGEGSALSYYDHGASRLSALCRANELPGELEAEALAAFRTLTAPWGARPVRSLLPAWRSDVSDDHTPFEFSVIYGGATPELRLLVEALGDPPSPAANWSAAIELAERVAGPPSEAVREVAALFAPVEDVGLGAWLAASLAPGRAPSWQIFFDAQAQGRWRAAAIVEEAVWRLGFARAWPSVIAAGRRGLDLDELRLVAVDLGAKPRAEIYWRHHRAGAADGARLGGPEAGELCRGLGGGDGPYIARPIYSVTELEDPAATEPASRAICFPVGAYAVNDSAAMARVSDTLRRAGLAPDRYRASVELSAHRTLDGSHGLHSYVLLRNRGGRRTVGVGFSPEAHAIARPRIDLASPEPLPVADAEEIVRRYEHDILLANHPFLSRLRREPVHLGHLWVILANFWEAIVHDFPGRLAKVIARLEDDQLRSIFVKQLNDELGEGDYSRAHKAMFRTLVAAVEPHRPRGDYEQLVAPGRRFGRALEARLFADDFYEAVGALMMIEIYGKQTDLRLGEEFRRQHQLDFEALKWLRLHESLEVDHADDSLRLAHILPRASDGPDARAKLDAVWRGAVGVVDAGHAYFDGLYQVCYP